MPKSLRRQKIFLERTLQRLVNEGVYVKIEEGYRLRKQVKLPDSKYPKVKINYDKLQISTRQKTLDEVLTGSDSQDLKPAIREFDSKFPNWGLS